MSDYGVNNYQSPIDRAFDRMFKLGEFSYLRDDYHPSATYQINITVEDVLPTSSGISSPYSKLY